MIGVLASGLLIWLNRDEPRVRARLELITFKVVGAVPDENWISIMRRMQPSSVRDSARTLRLEAARAGRPPAGAALFKAHCVNCHGERADGGTAGVDLTSGDVQARLSDLDIYTVLTQGKPGTDMPASGVGITEGLQLTAYVRSLHASDGRAPQKATGAVADCGVCKDIHVSSSDIAGYAANPADWLSYSGDYSGKRFSPLDQIKKTNLSRLRPRFIYQAKSLVGLEATPLVSKGVMFLTGPENEVIALNLATGEPFWVFRRVVPTGLKLCCGRQNRGVALLGDRVFYGTIDAHLVALDIRTGAPVWNVEVADYRNGYSMTGAPLAVDDKIIVGVAGGTSASGDSLMRMTLPRESGCGASIPFRSPAIPVMRRGRTIPGKRAEAQPG